MDTIRSGVVKTRKVHQCWGCREEIPKGSSVSCFVTVDAGQIVSAYWCAVCNDVVEEHSSEMEMDPYQEGFLFGEIIDEYPDLRAVAKAKIDEQA